MKQEMHICNKCKFKQLAPKGSTVWCPFCKPRVKNQMEILIMKPELQKIMRKEMQLNLGYFK